MSYRVLATDYDGTIAYEGRVDEDTVRALTAVRDAGLSLIMVTGRELSDLFNTFPHTEVFHCIVAENGAVVYRPGTKDIEALASPPPPTLIERLTRESVPFSVGRSVVATVEPHEHAVIAAIHDLGLDWHVIFNKGSVMALPSDVTKATGLAHVLEAFGTTWAETIAVGDAENDLAFLRRSGLAVAVGNALPSVKEIADVVTVGARGQGVVELIARWQSGDLANVPVNASRRAGLER